MKKNLLNNICTVHLVMINCLGEDVQIALTALGDRECCVCVIERERESILWTVCRGVGYGDDVDVARCGTDASRCLQVFKWVRTHNTHLTTVFICSASILYHPSKWLSQISFKSSLPKVVVVITQTIFLENVIILQKLLFSSKVHSII